MERHRIGDRIEHDAAAGLKTDLGQAQRGPLHRLSEGHCLGQLFPRPGFPRRKLRGPQSGDERKVDRVLFVESLEDHAVVGHVVQLVQGDDGTGAPFLDGDHQARRQFPAYQNRLDPRMPPHPFLDLGGIDVPDSGVRPQPRHHHDVRPLDLLGPQHLDLADGEIGVRQNEVRARSDRRLSPARRVFQPPPHLPVDLDGVSVVQPPEQHQPAQRDARRPHGPSTAAGLPRSAQRFNHCPPPSTTRFSDRPLRSSAPPGRESARPGPRSRCRPPRRSPATDSGGSSPAAC